MLVAIDSTTSCHPRVGSVLMGSPLLLRTDSRIILPPTTLSRMNASQWSRPSIHGRTEVPAAQPTTGMRA